MKLLKCTRRFLNPNSVIGLLLITVIAAMLFTAIFRRSHSSFEGVEGFEGQKELLLLHMEGCPHCTKLMPEWHKFVKNNTTSIQTNVVEKDENPSLINKYGVEGFPTILLLGKNGKKLDTYNGERNAGALLQYCKQNM